MSQGERGEKERGSEGRGGEGERKQKVPGLGVDCGQSNVYKYSTFEPVALREKQPHWVLKERNI